MNSKNLKIAIYALCIALVIVCTIILQIPIPATEGFVNFGDIMIFITAALFGPIAGLVAGGLGSCLADMFTGYMHWAPFTLVIKGLEGFICGLLIRKFYLKNSKGTASKILSLIAMTISGIIMVFGYFIGGWILKGSVAVSATSIPGNILQAGVSVVVAYIILFVINIAKKTERQRASMTNSRKRDNNTYTSHNTDNAPDDENTNDTL